MRFAVLLTYNPRTARIPATVGVPDRWTPVPTGGRPTRYSFTSGGSRRRGVNAHA